MDTWGYIERVRAEHGDCSDYRIAQLLGLSKQAISWYRQGRSADDETAARIADLIGEHRLHVMADIRSSRAEFDGNAMMASVWREVLAKFPATTVASPIPASKHSLAEEMSGRAPVDTESVKRPTRSGTPLAVDRAMLRKPRGPIAHKKAPYGASLSSAMMRFEMVAEDGIEPPTRGFSKRP